MRRSITFGILLATTPALAAAQRESLAPLPAALPRTHAPRPTAAPITAADLMTRLYIFADDSMRGRRVGRAGNAMGTAYIAAEVKRMGLQPAGDDGTYFQALPDFPAVLMNGAAMRVGKTALTLGTEFLPVGAHDLARGALDVVYGGTMEAPATLTPTQAKGKLVVFTTAAVPSLTSLKVPQVAGAKAVALVVLDSIAPQERSKIVLANLALEPQPDVPVVLLSGAAAKQLFGKEASAVTPGAGGQRVTAAFDFEPSARNVVAIIPGSDPVLRHQYVALGAHNDHVGSAPKPVGDHDSLRAFTHFASIGGAETGGARATASAEAVDSIKAVLAQLRKAHPPRPDSIFNGADDDGSGSVSILEVAEHIMAMKVKPKRSIIFVWHTGEEAGLLGSTYFTDHPTIPRDSIVAHINADMIGRGNASDIPGGGPDYVQVVGSRNLSTEFGRLVDTVNTRHKLAFDYETGAQYYTRSDHYMYAKHNIPIVFFITGVHPDYHQVTDEPEYIDYKKMARIASLIDDIAVTTADLDHRLVVDKPEQ